MRPFHVFDLRTDVQPPYTEEGFLIASAHLLGLKAVFLGNSQHYVKVSGDLGLIEELRLLSGGGLHYPNDDDDGNTI
ncbi:hypothetical protein JOH51_002282 [Rhizobium leguminosarum]|nr:hypothetical protein [Rhizobium leguminosarum]